MVRKICAILAVSALAAYPVCAQTISELWITGSAVPGGTLRLQKTPDGEYRFAGSLDEGELKIMTTENGGDGTYYLVPRYEDSYIVNNGLSYQMSSDASRPGWVVPFQEDRYRFSIDVKDRIVKGELFVPWQELYVAGGATSGGWEIFDMQAMTRDADDVMVWTWTGELREHPAYVEPTRFKLMGQERWGDKSLHPFVQDEDPLTTSLVRTGGDDKKWSISKEGIYRFTVDVFHETFRAEYLSSADGDVTRVEDVRTPDVRISKSSNRVTVESGTSVNVRLYDCSGGLAEARQGCRVELSLPGKGMYILHVEGQSGTIVRKVVN